MPYYTEAEINNLADAVRLVHGVFANVHDPLARKHGQKPFMILRVLNSEGPVRAAFAAASAHGYLIDLLDKMNEAHAFDEAAGDSDVTVVTNLQAMLNKDIGFGVPMVMVGGGQVACRRVCRIFIDGAAVGTGFLVGPQAILTACHVVDSLIGEDRKEVPNSHSRLEFEFERAGRDHPTERLLAARHWLLESSEPHALELKAEPFDLDSASDTGFDTCLDFALVRLDRAVGRERGWYKLDEKVRPCVSNSGSRAVTLFQHPAGGSMRLAHGKTIRLWPASHGTRVHHSANSCNASSGGLLLNSSYEMIGLHNATLERLARASNDAIASDDSKMFNAAIPTSAIAKARGIRDLANSIEGLDPVLRIPGSGAPVIGRDNFQRMVLQAVAGHKRILIARGASGTGKSFSAEILKAMLGTDNHKYVILQAADLSAIPEKLAATVLQPLVADNAFARLPSASDAQTATDAWIRDVLYPAMMEQLRRATGKVMLWLVVDNIDINPLPQSSSTHLLDRIFSEIERYDYLRVVLLAPKRNPNAPPSAVEIDDCVHPTPGDVKKYVERRLQEVGKGAQVPTIFVNAIMHMASTSGGVTAENVARAVNDWFEQEMQKP